MAVTIQTALPNVLTPLFGDKTWIRRAAVEPRLPPDLLILRAARVRVNRTPLWEIVGEPDPIDVHEVVGEKPDPECLGKDCPPDDPEMIDVTMGDDIAEHAVVIDHDPAKYAPYQWLAEMDGDFYLVEA